MSDGPGDVIDNDLVATLTELLGERFLSYVLGADDRAALPDVLSAPSPAQLGVLRQLATLAQPELLNRHPFARQIDLANILGIAQPGQPHNPANLLRASTAAVLPDSPARQGDRVEQELLILLQALFPLLLLPVPESHNFGPALGGAAHNHPNRTGLEDAIRQDPLLSKLFTTYDETSGWSGHTLRSTGFGGTVQLWGFAEQQIRLAWQTAGLDYPAPSFQDVALRMRSQLSVLRKAIGRRPVKVPARIGLTGVLLPTGTTELDLGWARIRPATELDRTLTPHTGIEGKLQMTAPDGELVTIDYAGDLAVELDTPYVVRLGQLDITAGWPQDLPQYTNLIEEKLESIRLGLVLALDTAEPVNVVPSWRVVDDPLATVLSAGWSDTRQVPNLTPRQLTEDEVEQWVVWAKRVQEHRTPSIAVAIRRMLRAISGRLNSDDVLVDAVIVWENLFGATQESTLRITASLAWLLGSDAADRTRRQNEYKVLYQARSDIVHGSSHARINPGLSCAQRNRR